MAKSGSTGVGFKSSVGCSEKQIGCLFYVKVRVFRSWETPVRAFQSGSSSEPPSARDGVPNSPTVARSRSQCRRNQLGDGSQHGSHGC